jgi:hypothetical protein
LTLIFYSFRLLCILHGILQDGRPRSHSCEYGYHSNEIIEKPLEVQAINPRVDEKEAEKICGLRRVTFWLAFSLVLVIVIGAVGGGVGGYFANKNAHNDSDSHSRFVSPALSFFCGLLAHLMHRDSGPFVTAIGSSTITVTGTSVVTTVIGSSTITISAPKHATTAANAPEANTKSGSTVTVTAPPISGPYQARHNCNIVLQPRNNYTISCPSADYCVSDVPSSTSKFYRECGTNRSGINLKSVAAWSMADCVNECVQYNSRNKAGACKGVTWVYDGEQETRLNYCWLKSTLTDPIPGDNMESGTLLEY